MAVHIHINGGRRLGKTVVRDAGVGIWEIEFDGKSGKYKIRNSSDEAVEEVARRLGLWRGDKSNFPSFTLFKNGQEIGGG